MKPKHPPNHLIHETSPYLLQHAHNPVDWYPWGEEALEKARRENKPLLISIGYAACHWCHVMEHESFEDQETADLMNKLFVNIKVDREERPDLDKIYQTTHVLLTQRGGGWPLTVFLTPDDLTPFYAGTYFPVKAHYQLPAFKEVLGSIANVYKQMPDEIAQQNAELRKILTPRAPDISDVHLNHQPIQHGLAALRRLFDSAHGGFGGAPKFPQEPVLDFLLLKNSEMVPGTLLALAKGGIFDQVGGGFFRYSVDVEWQIPHFEKMLYDNAQLLRLYASASRSFDEPFFAGIAARTADWMIKSMQAPEGGFYSSLDADSEGHEGKYYVWERDQIEAALDKQEYAVVNLYYGLDQDANFEKHWHLHVVRTLDETAAELKMQPIEVARLLIQANSKLLTIRDKRVSPARDEKILTAWNALAIKGMIIAGDVLKQPAYAKAGLQALNFIREKLWSGQRLLASYKDGRAHLNAYLDDYAFVIDALLECLQTRWETQHLSLAIELAEILLTHFYDANGGGFFFTASDHEQLLYRPKTMSDEAIPSGNAIAAKGFLTLGHLLGEPRYLQAAEKTLHAAWPFISQYPAQYCGMLGVLQEYLEPPQVIVIRGREPEINTWRLACKRNNNFVFAIPDQQANLPQALATKAARDKTCAYICEGLQCREVIEDVESLKEALKL